MSIRVGSLFTGYGGLEMGLSQVLGTRLSWVSDTDRSACKVLDHRYPGVPNLGDVTTIDWTRVDPVDLIAGGSPCTNLSQAGKREGLTGGESSLWFHMLTAVRTLRPRWVVWENVQGARTAKSDLPGVTALDRVTSQLVDAGYTVQDTMIPASAAGAPHRRNRVFVLATRLGSENLVRTMMDHQVHAPGRLLLPTVTVNDMGRGKTVQAWDEWTARMKAAHHNGNGHGRSLAIEVRRPGFEQTYGYALGYWAALTGRPYPDPLSPAFEEWMMGLPLGWVTRVPGVSDNQAHKLLGNGVVPQQAALALSWLIAQARKEDQ